MIVLPRELIIELDEAAEKRLITVFPKYGKNIQLGIEWVGVDICFIQRPRPSVEKMKQVIKSIQRRYPRITIVFNQEQHLVCLGYDQ